MRAVQGKGGDTGGKRRHAEDPSNPARTLCRARSRRVPGETREFEDVPITEQCGECRRRAAQLEER